MSSSNVTRHKSRTRSESDKHVNVAEHIGTKNDTHNKNTDTHKKHNFAAHTTVHDIKDSKKHVPVNSHTKNARAVAVDQAQQAMKHHRITDTHGAHSHFKSFSHSDTHEKISTRGHFNTRSLSEKSDVHKQRIDKHDKTDQDQIDHSEIDDAVFISISTVPEDDSPENLASTDQDEPQDD